MPGHLDITNAAASRPDCLANKQASYTQPTNMELRIRIRRTKVLQLYLQGGLLSKLYGFSVYIVNLTYLFFT